MPVDESWPGGGMNGVAFTAFLVIILLAFLGCCCCFCRREQLMDRAVDELARLYAVRRVAPDFGPGIAMGLPIAPIGEPVLEIQGDIIPDNAMITPTVYGVAIVVQIPGEEGVQEHH